MMDWRKMAVLALLVIQNSSHTLVLRYSRGILKEDFSLTTAVLLMELIKLAISCFMISRDWQADEQRRRKRPTSSTSSSSSAAAAAASAAALNDPTASFAGLLRTSVPLIVPAGIYFVQNSLSYVALQNLNSATFAVLSQLKLLTTAVFSVVLLGRHLSFRKWRALLLLLVGVVLIVSSSSPSKPAKPVEDDGESDDTSASTSSYATGLIAVLALVCCSGFAGVYFEMLLKFQHRSGKSTASAEVDKPRPKAVSVWGRNFQLGVWSIMFAVLRLVVFESHLLMERGFFYGYSWFSLLPILVGAAGGILVALVVKYADSIVKGFATSLAIVCTTIASHFLFGAEINVIFLSGVCNVLISMFNYSEPESTPVRAEDAKKLSAGGSRVVPKSQTTTV